MTPLPLAEGRLRVLSEIEPAWRLQCPGCGRWFYIDESQLHGLTPTDHADAGCTFHETRNWYATAEWTP